MTRSPKAEAKGRKLSNFLCFAVYSANLAFGRAYKPILDAVGLTYTQYIAMVALSEQDEQTVSALGEKLFLAIQHADADPQEAGADWLYQPCPRSRRRAAGKGEPDRGRPEHARERSRWGTGRGLRLR